MTNVLFYVIVKQRTRLSLPTLWLLSHFVSRQLSLLMIAERNGCTDIGHVHLFQPCWGQGSFSCLRTVQSTLMKQNLHFAYISPPCCCAYSFPLHRVSCLWCRKTEKTPNSGCVGPRMTGHKRSGSCVGLWNQNVKIQWLVRVEQWERECK